MTEIFVFGSNLKGIHGKGAALTAWKYHGAELKNGMGLQGNSYAIPTKDEQLRTLLLKDINQYVQEFLDFAQEHPEMTFKVTRVGCGLAGLQDRLIAPMFETAPENCKFDSKWREFLPDKNFWGSY